MDKPFLIDIQALRARAREHIRKGAVTTGHRADDVFLDPLHAFTE